MPRKSKERSTTSLSDDEVLVKNALGERFLELFPNGHFSAPVLSWLEGLSREQRNMLDSVDWGLGLIINRRQLYKWAKGMARADAERLVLLDLLRGGEQALGCFDTKWRPTVEGIARRAATHAMAYFDRQKQGILEEIGTKLAFEIYLRSHQFTVAGTAEAAGGSVDEASLKVLGPTVGQMNELAKDVGRVARNWDDLRDGRGGDRKSKAKPDQRKQLEQRAKELQTGWQCLMDFCEHEDYDVGWYEMLKNSRRHASLYEFAKNLPPFLRTAVYERNSYLAEGRRIPPNLDPQALILRRAAHELGIEADSYETLRGYVSPKKTGRGGSKKKI